jgi:hypothetical protein
MNSTNGLSRRLVIRHAACLTGAILGAATATESRAEEKLSKAEAKYQAHPNGQQRCGICLQFRPSNTCQIVAGPISPAGWCQYFAARENAH